MLVKDTDYADWIRKDGLQAGREGPVVSSDWTDKMIEVAQHIEWLELQLIALNAEFTKVCEQRDKYVARLTKEIAITTAFQNRMERARGAYRQMKAGNNGMSIIRHDSELRRAIGIEAENEYAPWQELRK